MDKALTNAAHVPHNTNDDENLKANTQHDLGKLQEAAASYRAVVELEPANADAHFNLAVVLQDDAGSVAISSGGTAVAALCLASPSSLRLLRAARESYAAALTLDPSITDARAAIAGIDTALEREAGEMRGTPEPMASQT